MKKKTSRGSQNMQNNILETVNDQPYIYQTIAPDNNMLDSK